MNRRALLGSVAVVALAVAANPALAQDANPPPQSAAQQSPNQDAAIVVTGSRVGGLQGFQAPTPTRVLSLEQIQERGLSNIGEFLNETPSFRPSQSPSTNTQSALGGGQFYADLRGLGSIRTLTLVDGRRFVSSSATGQVDLNLIPTLLVQRVDVVTGGASAAYGSDAISGVVNVILNRRLQGFLADMSVGISEQGDDAERRFSLAYGTSFANDRGHVVIGGEYVHSDGIGSYFSRDWGRRQDELVSYVGARPVDAPSRFYASGVQALNYAFGGVILGNNADTNPANGVDVLRGIQFGRGGTVIPFPYGTAIGTSAINFTGGDPTLYARNGHQLVLPVERKVLMANLDYELTDHISAFLQLNWGKSGADFHTSPVRDTTATGVVIRRDNPFLPAQVAAIMDANGITSFGLGRQDDDFGEVRAHNGNTTTRVVAGLNGDLGGGWTWDAYYQYGHNDFASRLNNLRIEQNFRFSYDAILLNGQPACRDATARAAGCVAINLFGAGSPSQAAINYVTGLATYDVALRQHVAAVNLRGHPFSTWAGPVAIAIGAEYRNESANGVADAISNAGGFNYGNPRSFAGSFNVKEGYAEVLVPLAHGAPVLGNLDLNGAVRYTDYSSTGGVTTWKVGATWEPIEGVRFRATRSRDIRAPNNSELFSTLTTRSSLINGFTGATDQLVVISQPSPALQPERSDTTTVGVVLSPRFLPGLNISVDYYDISIAGAISSFPAQTIIDRCVTEVGAGAAGFFCSFVDRTGTGNQTVINAVRTQLLNVARLQTNGVDFDVNYRFRMGPGRLTARLAGNYTAHLISDDGLGIPRTYNAAGIITNVGSVVDRAGQIGGFTSGLNNGATTVPHWTLNGSLSYSTDRFTTTVQGRYIQGGVLDRTLVGPGDRDYNAASPISIGSNRVDGRFYVNLSASYDILHEGNRRVQLYGLVNNLTNADPPFPVVAVSGLFDRVGRFYKVGVRVAY